MMSSSQWVPLLIPLVAMLAAGLLAGFLAGMFGIGGGFLAVPALFLVLPLLGGTPDAIAHVAVGTSVATIIATSIRSLLAHARRGAVEFEVLRTWAPWIMLGATVGVVLAGHLGGRWLTTIFAIGVGLMSLNFLLPRVGDKVISQEMPSGITRAGLAGGLGLYSAVLGIGGGTLMTMVMTLCGRSIHRSIGTAAGMGPFIAVPAAIGFAIVGLGAQGLPWGSLGYVNVPAAVAMASTSVITAPLGVTVAHNLPAVYLKRVFGVYLVFISFVMLRKALQM
jgi:uncharacterized membrane protein YfcA